MVYHAASRDLTNAPGLSHRPEGPFRLSVRRVEDLDPQFLQGDILSGAECRHRREDASVEVPLAKVDRNENGRRFAHAGFAKALGHPVRVRIFRILASRDVCICGDLVDALPIAQSTVSQHLKILKEAGLVQGEIDGPRVCYCIKGPALEKLKELVEEL